GLEHGEGERSETVKRAGMISKRIFTFVFLIALSAATDDVWTRLTPDLWDDEIASVNNDVLLVARLDQRIGPSNLDGSTLPSGVLDICASNSTPLPLPTSGHRCLANASARSSTDPLYMLMSLQQ